MVVAVTKGNPMIWSGSVRPFRRLERVPCSGTPSLQGNNTLSEERVVRTDIAGTAGRLLSAEFRRFLDISLGSLSEVGYALRFARELELLSPGEWKELNDHQQRAHYLTWKLYESVSRYQRTARPALDRPRPPSTA